jgi:hypothetical protein
VPLSDDTSRKGTEQNFKELKAAGYTNPKQRVAIVLSHRREVLKKKRAKKAG